MHDEACMENQASCFVHHTPCILHHATCITRHASCVVRPASCTLHQASCILHHSSFMQHYHGFESLFGFVRRFWHAKSRADNGQQRAKYARLFFRQIERLSQSSVPSRPMPLRAQGPTPTPKHPPHRRTPTTTQPHDHLPNDQAAAFGPWRFGLGVLGW